MNRLSLFRIGLLVGLALLHGCGEPPTEAGPGGVSADDARQLDEAAAKLDSESRPTSENTGKKSGN